jgi:hypothetical protein
MPSSARQRIRAGDVASVRSESSIAGRTLLCRAAR